jgi:voltage-gated potassium channel Kch
MVVLRQVIEGGGLIALTVAIHAAGAIGLLWFLGKYRPIWLRHDSLGFAVLSISGIVSCLVLLHLTEIAAWAFYYHLKGLFPDFETAAYYSLATYTTVGYGDVVLPREWRLEGTSEALVGILMTAWSTALLINVVNKFHAKVVERWDPIRNESPRQAQADLNEGGEGHE